MAEQEPQKISRVSITIAVIVSVVFCLLLYVGFVAFLNLLSTSSLSAGTRALLSVVAFGVLLMAPTLAVALIVVPVLKKTQQK